MSRNLKQLDRRNTTTTSLKEDQGRCLLLLLRIGSAHLDILGFPMGGAYYYRDISARFKTMRRKQNLASDFGIQKENWG